MGSEHAAIARQVDELRRDGSVVARFGSGEEAADWRAAMRSACRAAGLRVRTGLANGDELIAWAVHVDHEVTEADKRVARRAIEKYRDKWRFYAAATARPATSPSPGRSRPGPRPRMRSRPG